MGRVLTFTSPLKCMTTVSFSLFSFSITVDFLVQRRKDCFLNRNTGYNRHPLTKNGLKECKQFVVEE